MLGDRERAAGTYREFVAAQKRSLAPETRGIVSLEQNNAKTEFEPVDPIQVGMFCSLRHSNIEMSIHQYMQFYQTWGYMYAV